MTLSGLEMLLFTAAVVINIVTITIVVGYFWRTRNRSGNYLRDPQIPLRYFIQRQVDRHGKTKGYVCLLRTQDEDGHWTLPRDFDSLPLRRVISLLEETFASLPHEAKTLSIKLTYQQIVSNDFEYFIRWAITKIDPMQLSVEISISELNFKIQRHRFKHQIQIGRGYGMKFAVNNVGSQLNDLKQIEWLLGKIDILKASMDSFRKEDPNEWLDLNLQFWNKLAKKNQIELVLVGIEDEDDEKLAEQLKINARQGYLFGKPENIYRSQVKNNER